jgi:hypothetical protein
MKIVVAQLCLAYEKAQNASRDPSQIENRSELLSVAMDKRNEIESLLDVEMGILATGHTIERVVEATAELAYFSAWLGRRGGWLGSSFTGYPEL